MILIKDDDDDTWCYVDPKYPDYPLSPKYDDDVYAMQWRGRIAQENVEYIHELQNELDSLNHGHKVVIPKSKEHAEEMIRVAELYLKQNG